MKTRLTMPCENCSRYDSMTGQASVNRVRKLAMKMRQCDGEMYCVGV